MTNDQDSLAERLKELADGWEVAAAKNNPGGGEWVFIDLLIAEIRDLLPPAQEDDRAARMTADPEAYFRQARQRTRDQIRQEELRRRAPFLCRIGIHRGPFCGQPYGGFTCQTCGLEVRRT